MSGTLLASEVNLPLTSLDRNDSWHNGVRNVLKFHCSFSEFQTRHFYLPRKISSAYRKGECHFEPLWASYSYFDLKQWKVSTKNGTVQN